ncbi:T6SS phospholipase effector Tle1-like catalytic domain-containing protein [Pseudomonas nitroreducens]|uniref:T6SS phospholipase effector Tle1-like catalytic domain-containing protein n=1 Tax=Pseudomonas nitroreducens TaxID=46680 RepID=UPI0020A22420|nr:DUF2235 domain-containing protein [Pseudomonas nitroreducens]MCP1626809.1 hypothetical protein [Pseudomonas nitroreducens]
MSEINSKAAKVSAPPVFPVGGRLPGTTQVVLENYYQQTREESVYKQSRDEHGCRRWSACCHTLHISLFFDGTNNNDNNDTNAGHPTNIARLFHASMRGKEASDGGHFSYYMPGVGTAFPEIGEFDYSDDGLRFATGGENRINWALVSVAHALTYAIDQQRVITTEARAKAVESMATYPAPLMIALGGGRRRKVMGDLLSDLKVLLETKPPQPKPLAVKLYVYGFSRGAAEARTFVNWLSELFDTPEGADKPEQKLIGLPVSVEFLGLMDTVASVGIAHVAPLFAGHMDWADDTQLLPSEDKLPGFVRRCRHFVAAHEQRSCFPLDSLRNEEGEYPTMVEEVVYPGVHSDVGGGYQVGEQGKARGGSKELLSQIVLHDMYAEAFAAGAPLQVPEGMLPARLQCERSWRAMEPGTRDEFFIGDQVIERFNAWRHTVPGVTTVPPDTPPWEYKAQPLNLTLEQVLARQLYWITGWRIGRFANGSYKTQPFYTLAVQHDDERIKNDRAEYEEKLRKSRDARVLRPAEATNHPGPPIYEPQVDQTQMGQAAEEFRYDYSGEKREQTSGYGELLDVWLRDTIYLLNDDDEQRDHEEIKLAGEQCCRKLFLNDWGMPTSDPTLALVVALFDDQVHDSRAWFMHDKLKSREMWGGYFFYRMVYFGGDSSRRMTLVMAAGKLIGLTMIAGVTVYGIRLMRGNALKAAAAGVTGAAAGVLLAGVTYQVIDKTTGLALPFLPDAAELLKPTDHIGAVAAQLKRRIAVEDYAARMARSREYLRQTGSLFELAQETLR